MNWFVILGIVLTFLTALVGFITTLRNQQKIQEVHLLVNSQLDTVLKRVQQLTKALESSDTDVPDEETKSP